MATPFVCRFRSWIFRPLLLGGLLSLAGGVAGCSPAESPTTEEPGPTAAPVDGAASVEPAAETVAVEPRRAEVGVGIQGRSLDDETGVGKMIAQPAVSLFAVRERTVFEIQIPQAVQLFEATEGRKPNSHEEFMQRIIKANQIQLPELPAGQEYRYDVEKGELWVHPVE